MTKGEAATQGMDVIRTLISFEDREDRNVAKWQDSLDLEAATDMLGNLACVREIVGHVELLLAVRVLQLDPSLLKAIR